MAKMGKKFFKYIGEKFSGKTHLAKIFIRKFNGLKLKSNLLTNDDLIKLSFTKILS